MIGSKQVIAAIAELIDFIATYVYLLKQISGARETAVASEQL
jgi:hypothetical protein